MHVMYLLTFVVTLFLNVVPFTITFATELSIDNYPYMVSIHVDRNYHCAGSLVSKNVVVTTAKLLKDVQEESTKIRSGSACANSKGSVHNVSKIHVHPKFSNASSKNDICLIRFIGEINSMNHITLPEKGMAVDVNIEAEVLGFDFVDDIELVSSKLRVMDNHLCDCGLEETMFCGEYDDTIIKDFGGPVMYKGKMIGIASYRHMQTKLFIYTKVSEYVRFINLFIE